MSSINAEPQGRPPANNQRVGALPSLTSRRRMAHRIQLLGLAFAVAALMAPGVIALFGASSLLYKPPWLNAQAILTHRVLSLPQYALLTVGLSAAVVSCALATYRWSLSRRLLHLFLLCILLELFYRFAYGGAVSPGILLSVPETSGRETGELLAGHGILTGSLTVVALLALCALVVSWRSQLRFSPKACLQLGAVSAAMSETARTIPRTLLLVAKQATGTTHARYHGCR